MYWHILFLRCFKGWEIAAWIPLGCKRIAESDSREGRGQTFPPRRLVFKIEWTLTPPLDYIVTQLREDRQTPRHSDSQTPRCQTQKFKNWFNPTARQRDFCSVPAHHESPDWLWEVWSAPAAFVHMECSQVELLSDTDISLNIACQNRGNSNCLREKSDKM